MNIRTSKKYSSILPILDTDLWIGYDKSFVQRPSAVILNSHQKKLPLAGQEWMHKTFDAVSWAAHNSLVVLTSTELNTWEYTLYAASRMIAQILVLVPVNSKLGTRFIKQQMLDIMESFNLDATEVLLIPYESGSSKKELWLKRDQQLMDWSKVILPVSINTRGKLEQLIDNYAQTKTINDHYRCSYSPQSFKPSIPAKDEITSEIKSMMSLDFDYLVHWTRSSAKKWPDEKAYNYYYDLHEGKVYPRDAFSTLINMLENNHICASSWRMPMNKAMVSFSGLPPVEMLNRMTWRRRYSRFSFEPYGIGISKEALIKRGVREVSYGTLEEKKKLSASNRLYFQILSEKGDFFKESEFRYKGDITISDYDKCELAIFVRTKAEKEIITNKYGIKCYSFL